MSEYVSRGVGLIFWIAITTSASLLPSQDIDAMASVQLTSIPKTWRQEDLDQYKGVWKLSIDQSSDKDELAFLSDPIDASRIIFVQPHLKGLRIFTVNWNKKLETFVTESLDVQVAKINDGQLICATVDPKTKRYFFAKLETSQVGNRIEFYLPNETLTKQLIRDKEVVGELFNLGRGLAASFCFDPESLQGYLEDSKHSKALFDEVLFAAERILDNNEIAEKKNKNK